MPEVRFNYMRPYHCLVQRTRAQSLTLNKVDYYNSKTYVAFLLWGIIFHKSFKHLIVTFLLTYFYLTSILNIVYQYIFIVQISDITSVICNRAINSLMISDDSFRQRLYSSNVQRAYLTWILVTQIVTIHRKAKQLSYMTFA